MSKKLICLLLILGFVGSAGAAEFTDLMGDQNWNDSMNWDIFAVPTSTDLPYIGTTDNPNKSAVVKVGDTPPTSGSINISNYVDKSAGTGSLTVYGTLNVEGYITVARDYNNVGSLLIDGGTVNSTNCNAGRHGHATWDVINGGAFYGMQLQVAARTGTGTVHVNSGGLIDLTTLGGSTTLKVPGRWGMNPDPINKHHGHAEVYIGQDGVIRAGVLYWDPDMYSASFIEFSGNGRLEMTGYQVHKMEAALAAGLFKGAGGAPVYITYDGTNTIVDIPEPMTIALLGLGGLFLRRRK